MQDIYGIKSLFLNVPFNLYFNLIYLFLAVLIYFVLFYDKKVEKTYNEEKDILSEDELQKLIEDLKENLEKYSKDIFYNKLDYILRKMVKKQIGKNIDALSLAEIDKLDIDDILKDFIKSVYFKEYKKDIDDSLEIRKKYVEFLKI